LGLSNTRRYAKKFSPSYYARKDAWLSKGSPDQAVQAVQAVQAKLPHPTLFCFN
jgi:hypothetical protein